MSGYWSFNNLGSYSGLILNLDHIQSTGLLYHGIVDSVSPTIEFLYHNVLLNPIFMGILLVFVVLSLFLNNGD